MAADLMTMDRHRERTQPARIERDKCPLRGAHDLAFIPTLEIAESTEIVANMSATISLMRTSDLMSAPKTYIVR